MSMARFSHVKIKECKRGNMNNGMSCTCTVESKFNNIIQDAEKFTSDLTLCSMLFSVI